MARHSGTPVRKSGLRLSPRVKRTKVRKQKPSTSPAIQRSKSSKKQREADAPMAGRVEENEKEANYEEKDVTPYRSSLGGIISLIEELKLRDCHKDILKKTPFWELFNAIIKGKVSVNNCRKSDKLIQRIIRAYDPAERKFRLGPELVELTCGDIRNIFGVTGGNEEFFLKNGSRNRVKMVKRRKWELMRLKSPEIRRLLMLYVDGESDDDIKDVAILLCLYLCHTFFFPTGTTVKWVYLERIEDMDRLNRYNWCAAIVNGVLGSIEKHHSEPWKCTGCVMALLYWLCEHTNLVTPQLRHSSPAFLKWSIPILAKKFDMVALENLEQSQVVVEPTYNMVQSIAETATDGVCAPRNVTLSDTMLSCDEMERKTSCSIKNETPRGYYNADNDRQGCGNESSVTPTHNHVDNCFGMGISLGDCARIGKEAEGVEDSNLPRAGEGQTSEIETLHCKISVLIGQAREKEIEHTREMEIKDTDIAMKDAEIARLNDYILHLLDENSRLADELDEPIVHAITQQITGTVDEVTTVEATNNEEKGIQEDAEDKETVRSMVLRIKNKVRKGNEQQEFMYDKKKRKKANDTKEQSKGVENMTVVHVSSTPEGMEHVHNRPEPIKNMKSLPVFRLLCKEDKEKILQMWKSAYSGTCVWRGGEFGSTVFVEDFRQLIIDSSISGFVIDACSASLRREQENRKCNLQNNGTQSSTESYVFTSSCFELIVRSSPEVRPKLLSKWIAKARGCRYFHFPIHKGHHWTLLVHDTEEGTWKFFNSSLPRTGVDRHCEAAEQLKKQVENYWKSTLDGLLTTQDCQPIVRCLECPQQGPSSLDCGIVVCYIIRQYFLNEPIPRTLTQADCRKFRASMVHHFLNDGVNSWSLEKQIEDEKIKESRMGLI